MHTVYLENRSVVFCVLSELPSQVDESSVIRGCDSISLKHIADDLISGRLPSDVYVIDAEKGRLFSEFSSLFRAINAGGGVVTKDGKYLMIYRRGMWDLPKGKQEEGEPIETCALREVAEETGLDGVKLGSLICITHHIYRLDGVFCIKHTHWFSMLYNGEKTPVPQVEEEITAVEWMTMEDMSGRTSSSYRSIREVISNL